MLIHNLVATGSAIVSGSSIITGNLTVLGSISGSINSAISASYALNATSASYALNATSASYSNNSTNTLSASYAQTSSYADTFTVAGTLTAQKLVVQTITSSIVYSSGSNVFGNSLSNTQSITGSLQVTGSTHYLLGNVGIGTTSPDSYSDPANNLVVGTTSGNNGITISAATTGISSIYFADGTTGNEAYRGYLEYGHTNDYLAFGTAASERMRITSSGNVGIGTTSPVAKLHLVVPGSVDFAPAIAIRDADNTTYGFTFKLDTLVNGNMQLDRVNADVNTAMMTFQRSTGNVGIGTTSPVYKLDVYSATSPATIGLKTDATYNSVFRDYIATTDTYLDITTERTDGGGFNFLLLVSSTLVASASNRNYYTFAVAGRGTTATATQLSNVTAGTSARTAIAVSFPSNGVIRLTLTGAETCQIKVTAMGHGSL